MYKKKKIRLAAGRRRCRAAGRRRRRHAGTSNVQITWLGSRHGIWPQCSAVRQCKRRTASSPPSSPQQQCRHATFPPARLMFKIDKYQEK